MLSLGEGLGSIVWPWLSDVFGRKRIIVISMALMFVTTFVAGFAPNYAVFTVSKFFVGCFETVRSTMVLLGLNLFVTFLFLFIYSCIHLFRGGLLCCWTDRVLFCSFLSGKEVSRIQIYLCIDWFVKMFIPLAPCRIRWIYCTILQPFCSVVVVETYGWMSGLRRHCDTHWHCLPLPRDLTSNQSPDILKSETQLNSQSFGQTTVNS